MFPEIKSINDVLPYIEGNDNFSINKKDDYIVIDYILNTPDLFNDPYQKECRGLLFHADGRIMSRRLHKFFNVNEREESRIENVDLSKPHWILEKLDGSMITPVFTQGKWTWGSKAGVTFLTPMIEDFVRNNENYKNFFEDCSTIQEEYGDCIFDRTTFIFEYCSRKNRIVVDHPKDRLVLIAARMNKTGKYFTYAQMQEIANLYGLEVVQQFEGTVEHMQHLVDITKSLKGVEGFVVRFNDGHMIKIKADEYIKFHRAKDDFLSEKTIVEMIVSGKIDDFKSLLQRDDINKLERFEGDLIPNLNEHCRAIAKLCGQYRVSTISRKDFALNVADKLNPLYKKYIFKYFDKDPLVIDIFEDVYETVKQNCGTNARLESVRPLFNNIRWQDYLQADGEDQ